MIPDISDAIVALGFNGGFKIKGNKIAVWYRDDVQPTQSEIDTKLVELQTEHDAQAYSRKREAEYPSIQECVHAILDDTLDALQAKRASVKLKYPKGG